MKFNLYIAAIGLISTIRSTDARTLEESVSIDLAGKSNNFLSAQVQDYLANTNEKGFIFDGISKYKDFRACMEKAAEIYRYIDYHKTLYLSGFYDGQWKMIAHQKEPCSHSLSEGKYKRCTDQHQFVDSWNKDGQRDISGAALDDGLKRLGSNFQDRGYSSGRVSFAVEFDKVKRNKGLERSYNGYDNSQQTTSPNAFIGVGGTRRLTENKASESFAVSKFLNQEFVHMDYMNDRVMDKLMKEQYYDILQTNSVPLLKMQYNIEDQMRQKIMALHLNETLDHALTEEGHLSQRDQQYFLQSIADRQAYFKGTLYANDQFKEEELYIEFTINNKIQAFNSSRSVQFQEVTDSNGQPSQIPGQVKFVNVPAKLSHIKNFWPKDTQICNVNVTLDTLKFKDSGLTQGYNPTRDSILLSAQDASEMKMRFQIESNEECFPNRVQIDLKPFDILKVCSEANNYGMMLMFCVLISFGGIMSQFKLIIQNAQAAKSLSMISLSMSLVWNFSIFWMHFVYAGMNNYYDFIRIPACGYFLTSFLFEFRLLQEVFKVQNNDILDNSEQLRKRFIFLYVSIYISFVLFFIYRDYLVYSPWIIIFSNGSLWLPQIHQNYRTNLRNHQPSMAYYISLTVCQTFPLLYLYGWPQSFLEHESSLIPMGILCLVLALQLGLLQAQQIYGPKFFVPYEYRIDPNAYNYYFKFSKRNSTAANDPERADHQEEEHIECVICMNKIIYELDSDGQLINLKANSSSAQSIEMSQVNTNASDDSTEQLNNNPDGEGPISADFKKATWFMKTPCGHRYHPVCLKKWMEVRHECPFCRQSIPIIDE